MFRDDELIELEFTVDPADERHIEEHGNDEVFRPAQVTVRGAALPEVSFPLVGLRHKGAVSLRRCWDDNGGVRSHVGECEKLSYKVKFSEYEKRSLNGLNRLNLHSMSADPSKLRELLGHSLFRDFGVVAPRAVPATVRINGEFKGLFLAVEEIDARFVKAHFPTAAGGNVYKEVWPVAGVPDEAFIGALETNEKRADVSRFRAFAEAIANSGPETFEASMTPWVDLDAVLRYIAVDRAIKAWDGIMAFYKQRSPHNFFWYQEDGGRAHLIPWDLDSVLWEFDPFMAPEQWVTAEAIPDWNTAPRNCERRSVWVPENKTGITPPRCDHFLNLLARTRWARFEQLGRELLAGPLQVEPLREKTRYFRERLQDLVAADPTLDLDRWYAETELLEQSFERIVRDFQAFVDGGLREEQPPSESPETLGSDVLDAPTLDAGLHVGAVTNFEFEEAPALGVSGVEVQASSATFAVGWNNTSPISGRADLAFDFTFHSNPGPDNESLALALLTDETDVSGYSAVVMTLASNVRRNVRVSIASAAYGDDFRGIPPDFGREVSVSTTPKRIVLSLQSLYYPRSVRAGFASDQGFGDSEAEGRRRALQRFQGLIFSPPPTLNAAHELSNASEAGSLRIDNVYFQ